MAKQTTTIRVGKDVKTVLFMLKKKFTMQSIDAVILWLVALHNKRR